MTATDTLAGLLRAVLEAPDDDGLRLVVADAYDEAGQPERAAFVRDQIATGNALSFVCRHYDGPEADFFEPFGAGSVACRRGFVWWIDITVAAFMANAAAIFRVHPVTEVRLTDREPSPGNMSMGSGWNIDPSFNLPGRNATLPPELFALLAGGRLMANDTFRHYRGVDWPTKVLADLSAACVAYGRQQAGLSPLEAVA